MKNFKQKLTESDKKWDVIEELFDELGIKNHGVFSDFEAGIVFVRMDSLAIDSDMIERAMGLDPWFNTIGTVGVLTDKGPYNRKEGGWIYINYKKVLTLLGE